MNTERALMDKVLELERELQERDNDLRACKNATGEFIYLASHDLRAPLRKLSVFTERLVYKSADVLGEESLSYIVRIENAVAAMHSLVDGLSAFSEISATDFDFRVCDLNNVLREAIKDLALSIKENDADIQTSHLPQIEGNAPHLKTAFKHLISNSIKFKKQDVAPQILIASELLQPEEKKVHGLPPDAIYHRIEFTDNGIGFKAEYAEKILHAFQRLHPKSSYSGTGLGLAMCKKIIDKHHGLIYAEANGNSGAKFILILPKIRK
ncbi:MAG: ATP-binding protein [Chitinophagaceae bacterium]